MQIIDDYGHHPVEIAAVLKAARQAVSNTPGARVIAVHQPHRYSRLSNLFEEFCTCFNEADVVGIADVYAAGEDPIPGASRDDLIAGLIAHGHRHARSVIDEADLARLFREQAHPGDICLSRRRHHFLYLGRRPAGQVDRAGGLGAVEREIALILLGLTVLGGAVLGTHLWRAGQRVAHVLALVVIAVTGGTFWLIGEGMSNGWFAGLGWVVAGLALWAGPGLGMLIGLLIGLALGPYPQKEGPP
ncbi:MAG: cyanophycin synthetase [Paracoccaceae bacterium]